jgi:hypothetical protein
MIVVTGIKNPVALFVLGTAEQVCNECVHGLADERERTIWEPQGMFDRCGIGQRQAWNEGLVFGTETRSTIFIGRSVMNASGYSIVSSLTR